MSRRKRKLPPEPVVVEISDLGHDGRGVGRRTESAPESASHRSPEPVAGPFQGRSSTPETPPAKAVFVHGALPGETVKAKILERRRDFDEGVAVEIGQPSPQRVDPACPWFGYCGGCALQHLDHAAQLEFKEQRLRENLARIGKVEPSEWLAPVSADPWHYRRRARLSVRLVRGKGRVLVGFREQDGRFVADVEHCRILHPDFSDRLMELSELVGQLSIADRIPQIETASGDDRSAVVIRHLEPLSESDRARLAEWSARTGIAVYLQSKGPDSVALLAPEEFTLDYGLPEFDVTLRFEPQHFIQVNAGVNRGLVTRAVGMLELSPDDRVLDLFCGLGNFSLPLARRAGRVTAVEGEPALVRAGKDNALRNGLENVDFLTADLAGQELDLPWIKAGFDAVLIDPPRSGAAETLPLVNASGAKRVVYVSCNPATLARDASTLVNQHGFRLAAAGIADMFPHTAHVESVALFEKA